MLNKTYKKVFKFLLILCIAIAALISAEITVYAADNTISSQNLSVIVDDTYPNVIQYTYTPNGGVLYGNITGEKTIKINGTAYSGSQLTITSTKYSDRIEYRISVNPINVVVDIKFQVMDNILNIDITGIQENASTQVNTIEFSNNQLVSVKSNQTQATAAFTTFRHEFDGFEEEITAVSTLTGADKRYCAYAFVNNDKVSAGIFNNVIVDRYIVEWNGVPNETATFASLYNGVYYYRIAGQVQPFLSTKIGIFSDSNNDSVVNWQDAAVWYRSNISKPQHIDNVSNSIISSIVIGGQSNDTAQTFQGALDIIKNIYNLTNGRKHIAFLVGYQGIGHDTEFPTFTNVMEKAGGKDKLIWLINEAKKYNCTVTLHINNDDSYYSAGSGYDPEIWARSADVSPRLGWFWYDPDCYLISHTKDYLKGSSLSRLNELMNTLPDLDEFLYTDVYQPNRSFEVGYDYTEEAWAMRNIASQFNEKGFAFASETELPYLDDYQAYVMAQNGEGHDSKIAKFIKFNLLEHDKGGYWYGPAYQWPELLRYTDHSNLSWDSGSVDKNLETFLETQYLYTLPVKFTKNHNLLSIVEDNRYETAKFADNITAEYDKFTGEYKLRQGEDFYVAKDWSVFMPREDNDSDILFYSKKGTINTWKLPASWTSLNNVKLYKLTKNSRVFDRDIPVVSGSVTISNPIAGQAYILVRENAVLNPVAGNYGEGDYLANGDFESGDLSGWSKVSPDSDYSHITIKDSTLQISMLGGHVNKHILWIAGKDAKEGGVQQTITGLTGGNTYALYVTHKANGRIGKYGVRFANGQEVSAKVVDSGWLIRRLVFTVPLGQTQATVFLKAESGGSPQSFVAFDHIYVRPYNYTVTDTKGHMYYIDFEDLDYDNMVRIDAYRSMVITQKTSEVISGNSSVFTTNDYVSYDHKIEDADFLITDPAVMPLKGGRTYNVTLKYKITRAPNEGGYFYIYAARANNTHATQKIYLNGNVGTSYTKSINFTLDEFDDYRIIIGGRYGGRASFDDIAIDENNVVNPGFETGTKENWLEWNPGGSSAVTIESSGTYDGSYYAQMYSSSPYQQSIEQKYKKLPIGTYKLSAMVKSSGGLNALRMILGDEGTSQESWLILPTTPIADWTKYETQLNITSGNAKIAIYTDASNGNGKWTMWDNIKLNRIDLTENYLSNSSFETGNIDNWSEWYPSGQGSKVSVQNEGAYDGTNYVKYSSSTPYAQTIFQSMDLPNGKYKLSAWVRYSGGANNAVLSIQDSETGRRSSAVINPVGASYWTKYETELFISSGKVIVELYIDALNASNVFLEWDKVSLERIEEGEIRNGSFERGSFSGWEERVPAGQASKAIIQTNGAHSGNYYAKFISTTPYTQDLFQKFSNLPIGKYKLSAWVKYSGGALATMKLSDMVNGQNTVLALTSQGVAEWTKYEAELFINSGEAMVELCIDANADATKWICWDDVSLELVENYVANPSFDTGNKNNWSEWYPDGQGSKATIDSSIKFDGAYSIKFSTTGPYQQDMIQDVQVPNGKYKLSAWIYYSGGANWATMLLTDVINPSSSSNPGARYNITSAVPGWRKIETELFITSGKARIELYVDASNNNPPTNNVWIYWDNIKLEKVLDEDYGYAQRKDITNIKNGSFETGTMSNWNVNGTNASIQNTDSHSGTYHIKFYSSSPYTQKMSQSFLLNRWKNSGEYYNTGLYKLTLWVKYSGGASAKIKAMDLGLTSIAERVHTKMKNIYESTIIYELPATGLSEWTKIEILIPLYYGNGMVELSIDDSTGGKWVCWDDVSFEKVAELSAIGNNIIQNSGFENGKTGWIETLGTNTNATINTDKPYEGISYLAVTYSQSLAQTFTGLTNGVYKITVPVKYSGNGAKAQIIASQNSSTIASMYKELPLFGIDDWTVQEMYVPVETGNLKIELYIEGTQSTWINWDDVKAVRCN